MAWRRACRSPRLPSVTSFSTIGRRSFAFGKRGDDLLMLDERGRHVLEHRLAMLGRAVELAVSLAVTHSPGPSQVAEPSPGRSVMLFEALGELFDVLRRPARHFHAEMQAHLRQTSLISFSDLRPKFGVRSISASVFWIRSPI